MAERNLAVVNANSAIANDDMFSDARVEMIRNQTAKGAPEDVFVAFLDIAKRRNLDPLSKQISLIKFGGQFTIITTIDGYRAIAEQTGQYVGSDAPVFTYTGAKTQAGKNAPDTATVTVHKLINGHAYPFSATVYFEEYSTGMNNWSTMPRTMLAKVAESHALRKAFPAVMSGMYEESEMDQAIEGTARVVSDHQPRNHNKPPEAHSGRVTASVSKPDTTPDDPKDAAMRRLHAVATKHGITHEDLHRQAIENGGNSLADYDAKVLNDTADAIEQRTEAALAYYEMLRKKSEPAPDAQKEMDEINAAVSAEFDAQSDTDSDPAKWRG